MLTKEQKKKQVELGQDLLKKSKTLVFADFTGVDTASIRKLKIEVKKATSATANAGQAGSGQAGATFKVIKKRLLSIALKNSGIDFDPLQFSAQVGTFFIPEDLSSVASSIYKFAKELARSKKEFKVLGAYDLVAKTAVSVEEFTTVAKLPSREVMLAMVMGAITGPLRAFMYVLGELSKRTAGSTPVAEEKVVT